MICKYQPGGGSQWLHLNISTAAVADCLDVSGAQLREMFMFFFLLTYVGYVLLLSVHILDLSLMSAVRVPLTD